ncbi:RNA-dependent RNA polymerase [Zhejiang mosquito virus 3]|uniref:RNA-dependent RNA polymerase n=1 Tax=Zhejiang mosquito virus 3 TaxID=1923779 RepID=UPI00090C73AE|nr:RNA-dependent RNA polymerase [Zhejiang mosquito virus 3]APG77146.1 RNA-dependent RNA polymerase [Zhejiang mosquito virus 3]
MSLPEGVSGAIPPRTPAGSHEPASAQVGRPQPSPKGLARKTNHTQIPPTIVDPKSSPRRAHPPKKARAPGKATTKPPASVQQKQAQHIWDAFRLSLWVLLPRLQKRGLSTKAVATIEAIKALYGWIGNSVACSGVEFTAKQVKEYANYCRARALRAQQCEPPRGFPIRAFERGYIHAMLACPGQGRLHLAQLARVGRAMPIGTTKVAIASLRKHREVLSQPMDTEPALVEKLRAWAEIWTRERLGAGGRTLTNPAAHFSRSASATVSALKGGQLTELRQLPAVAEHYALIQELLGDQLDPVTGEPFEWDPYTFDADGGAIGLLTSASEADDLQILADCALRTATEHAADNTPIPMTATVISELGMKARVVTKPPAWAVVAGDACRKTVWPLLEGDRRIDLSGVRPTAEVLDAFHDNLAHSLVGARSTQFYSADLTAATDLMPFDVSRAMWNGLCDGLGATATAPLRKLGLYLLGPVQVSYPDLSALPASSKLYVAGERVECLSERGCMMGLPVSWTVLNLYNLAMADLACTPEGSPVLVNVAPAIARGDDLVAAIPAEEATRYEDLIAATGGEANRLKSFRSADAFVLAERTFEVGVLRRPNVELKQRGYVTRRTYRTAPLLAQFDSAELHGGTGDTRRLGDAPEVVAIRMACDVPIRSLLGGGPRTVGANPVPDYVSIPPAAAACLAEFEGTRLYRSVAEGLMSVHRGLVADLRRSAIPLFYPRELGGAGFPHPKGFAAAVASAGELGLKRAGLALTTAGHKAQQKVGLLSCPWSPKLTDRRAKEARRRLIASDQRAWANSVLARHPDLPRGGSAWTNRAAGELRKALSVPSRGFETVPRGARVAVALEDAVIREVAAAAAWEDAFLGPGARGWSGVPPPMQEPSRKRSARQKEESLGMYPSLGEVARRLKTIRSQTQAARFNRTFLPKRAVQERARFFDRLKALRELETVLVPAQAAGARLVVFDPVTHRVSESAGEIDGGEGRMGFPLWRHTLQERKGKRGAQGQEAAVPVPVATTRSGLSLGDVMTVRRLPRRPRGVRRLPNRSGAHSRNVR